MLLLRTLGVILLIILFLLAVLILIPYTYAVKGDKRESKIEFSLLWLFGLMGIRYSKNFKQDDELKVFLFNSSKKVNIKRKETKKEKVKEKDNKVSKKNKIRLKNHINKGVFDKLLILVRKILREIKPGKVEADAKIGFSDPMYTGLLFAAYSQVSYLPVAKDIKVEPAFDEEVFKGWFFVGGRIWVFYILAAILVFLLSKPVRHEIKLIIKKKGVI